MPETTILFSYISILLAVIIATIAIINITRSITRRNVKKEYEGLIRSYDKDINDLKDKNTIAPNPDLPVRQIEKIIYDKFLYIKKRDQSPIYKAHVKRTNEYVDVFDEKFSIRINKFSSKTSITTRDRSSGIIDLSFLLPFKDELSFLDKPSRKNKNTVFQDLSGEDTYVSTTTYYNGFQPEHEDLASKMEMDTETLRFIVDFSSIPDIEEIFSKNPNLYKFNIDGSKLTIDKKLSVFKQGIYYAEVHNLKKGEVVYLDFHINWEYLNQKESKNL